VDSLAQSRVDRIGNPPPFREIRFFSSEAPVSSSGPCLFMDRLDSANFSFSVLHFEV